jgi:4-aminobutyrate aminotransferase-like enzyme/Ser/Thr protein kinase RdoA (MazF antagonist)
VRVDRDQPATGPIALPPELIAEILEEHFGLRADNVQPLGGEVDQNSLVSCTDGRSVVVKLAPPGTDLEQLRWQHQLLAGLPVGPDVPPVPAVVAALDGNDVATIAHGGVQRLLRVQTWLPGRTLAELNHHSPELLHEWGRVAAQLVIALPDDAPTGVLPATHHWDVLRAPQAIEANLGAVHDARAVSHVQRILRWFADIVGPSAAELPRQVVHQDLNDFNVLAQSDDIGRFHISGVLDFGDALYTARVSEVAIAVAYAMLRKRDPLVAAAEVARGYCELVPLDDVELRVLYPIAAARLCVNAVTWTAREPVNGDYARARMQHTWPAIAELAQLPPALAEGWLRDAIGDRRTTPAQRVTRSLQGIALAPALDPAPRNEAAIGRHLQRRDGRLTRRQTDAGVPKTVHLGVDWYPLTPVELSTPLGGVIESSDSTAVLVRHPLPSSPTFWSRWTGLTTHHTAGDIVAAGTSIGHVTADPEQLAAPVRVCLFADIEAADLAPADFVSVPSVAAWRSICPDPRAFLGLTESADEPAEPTAVALARARDAHFAASQRHYYDRPARFVGSADVWLYDDSGLAYLDAINNVTHVGHANAAVCAAADRQMRRLNTNSRFMYDGIADYAERLTALLPDPLDVVFLVCTGSEANDLALRIARQVTGREHVLVIDGAYHGNTTAVTGISPNRYNGPGGAGAPPTTHEVEQPNRYRGRYGYADSDAGAKYAASVAAETARLVTTGTPPAAFIAESLLGTAGTIVHPDGYLATAFAAVRAAGGLCISDEVQVGFGRLGSAFWGFQTQGVVPDIVTMGKPIGNGYPLAAVVTTREIADQFDSGMKYFNTFGGNPVSCAVGMAVLDELHDRSLPAAAADVGDYFRRFLLGLQQRHELIGDVRGFGLYLGIELVTDRVTKTPAGAHAQYISERMKDEGVLVYPTGAMNNVLKIKPPMTFTREHVDVFTEVLEGVLATDW